MNKFTQSLILGGITLVSAVVAAAIMRFFNEDEGWVAFISRVIMYASLIFPGLYAGTMNDSLRCSLRLPRLWRK